MALIALTEKAILQLKKMSEEMEIGHLTIRVGLKGAGCSGFKYDMMFDDIIGEMDEVLEQDGIKIVVDGISAQYLEGTSIDYQDTLMSSGFTFTSPKALGSCGCGKSVAF